VSALTNAIATGLDRGLQIPLHRQLYAEIRQAVLEGRLRPGIRLPSSRTLASELHLARNTVLSAYDQLIAEGYLQVRRGSGAYVVDTLPGIRSGEFRSKPLAAGRYKTPSRRGVSLQKLAPLLPPPNPIPFRHGFPALEEFPRKTWARLVGKHWRTVSKAGLGYGTAQGFFPLRQAIADYLAAFRAVKCSPHQIIVVAGSQQAIYLAGQVTLDPGEPVLVEDPGYMGARAALLAAGAKLVPGAVDDEGLDVMDPDLQKLRPRMIYSTPSNQYPTTVTMTLNRRRCLLDWAYRRGAWILEDDYDSEFRYDSRPIAALQGLDERGCVIYVGTFSKLLVPSLRLGYIVAPSSLVDPLTAASAVVTRHPPAAEQMVLARFIDEGHLSRHVKRMKVIYRDRRDALLASARKHASGLFEIECPAGGTHVIGELKPRLSDVRVALRAAEFGVECRPLSKYYLRRRGRNGLILGYGGFSPAAIDRAMVRLVESVATLGPITSH
jgi:GntR family transcriptional regulator/MocR family aminotransferase